MAEALERFIKSLPEANLWVPVDNIFPVILSVLKVED